MVSNKSDEQSSPSDLGAGSRENLIDSKIGSAASGRAAGIPPKVIALAAQAAGACLMSGLGLAIRGGLSWATYAAFVARQLRAMAADEGAPTDGIRVLLDETLAHLREIGELSVQEARVLQKDLVQLSQRLRDLDATDVAEPRRYARAKA